MGVGGGELKESLSTNERGLKGYVDVTMKRFHRWIFSLQDSHGVNNKGYARRSMCRQYNVAYWITKRGRMCAEYTGGTCR